MIIPTEADLLKVVQGRFPTLSLDEQTKIARSALKIMGQPSMQKVGIHPMTAVKMADAQRKHRKHF